MSDADDYGVISTSMLQNNNNFWVILPPKNISSKVSCIVADNNGKVKMIADKHLLTDPNDHGTYNCSIKLNERHILIIVF